MPRDGIEMHHRTWPATNWKGAATGVTLGVLLSLPVWIAIGVAVALLLH